MRDIAAQPPEHEWLEYYEAFQPHCVAENVRPGCHPRKRTRPDSERSIVLVHGLSDSPYYMADIADYFHLGLGYNVFLPLLHFHGLKTPNGMEGIELEEWKRNVSFALQQAHALTPGHVSIGGLSTGGALSFYMACTSPKVTGDLFLFSAALDLIVGGFGPLGDIVERLLLSPRLTEFLDKRDADKPLVADNPVKYAYVDRDGARELARLIKEIDVLMDGFDQDDPFPRRVFAAHSRADDTANIAGVRKLQARTPAERFHSFYLDASVGVTHGGLVLKHDVVGTSGAMCTPRNVRFDEMIAAMERFVLSG